MTDTQTSSEPIDVVAQRLNDPAVAASVVTILDHADLLSTLVLGLSGFIERSDTVMDSVAQAVQEFKASDPGVSSDLPSLSDLRHMAAQLAEVMPMLSEVTPLLTQLVESPIARPETIGLLGDLSAAATEGAARARSNDTAVTGVFNAARSLKDPEVQRGMGVLLEIAKSIGQRMNPA